MRLNELEKQTIISCARKVFGNQAEIYLFGSRVDDSKRGGDIDLYVKLPSAINGQEKLLKKISLNTALINALGDQKFDILVNDSTDHKLIYEVAEKEGIRLC